MNSRKRRVAAYIAGRLISGKQSTAVYDYAAAAHTKIYGEASPSYISVFDYDRYSYIIGGPTPSGLSLFDYYTRQNFRLSISGSNFYGYDYETSSYFSGDVNQSSVAFFDYEISKNFRYTI